MRYRYYLKDVVGYNGTVQADSAKEAADMIAAELRDLDGEDWWGHVVIVTDDYGESASATI